MTLKAILRKATKSTISFWTYSYLVIITNISFPQILLLVLSFPYKERMEEAGFYVIYNKKSYNIRSTCGMPDTKVI